MTQMAEELISTVPHEPVAITVPDEPVAWIPKSKFWNYLKESEQKLLAVISDETPIAVRNLRGILDTYAHLLKNRKREKLVAFFALLGRIALNMFTVWNTARFVWTATTGEITFGSEHSSVKLKGNLLRICTHATVVNRGGCITTEDSRLYVIIVVAVAEVAVATLLVFTFLLSVVHFLRCSPKTTSQSFSKRAEFAAARPFVFTLVPRYASGFSFLKLLPYATPQSAYKIVFQGNAALVSMLSASIFPSCMNCHSWGKGTAIGSCANFVLRAMCFLAMLWLGASALFVKLTILFFVSFTGPLHWNVLEWLQMIGFVNQIFTIFDADLIELSRLLKFNLGGREGRWTETRHEEPLLKLVGTYAQLATKELVNGEVNEKKKGEAHLPGLYSLAVLCTFNAGDLQRLMLSKARQQSQEKCFDDRFKMIEEIFDESFQNESKMEQLTQLRRSRDQLLGGLFAAEEERLRAVGANINLAAEKLRMIAELQEHIFNLEKDLLKKLQATYTFDPESVKLLGIECDADGKVTTILDDSQAKDKDIKTGYRIVKVANVKFSQEKFAKARDGNAVYSLTFEVRPKPDGQADMVEYLKRL